MPYKKASVYFITLLALHTQEITDLRKLHNSSFKQCHIGDFIFFHMISYFIWYNLILRCLLECVHTSKSRLIKGSHEVAR